MAHASNLGLTIRVRHSVGITSIRIPIADFHTLAHGYWTGAKEEHSEGYSAP